MPTSFWFYMAGFFPWIFLSLCVKIVARAVSLPRRYASCNLHSASGEFWPDSQSWWNPRWKPPLLQLAWFQRGHHRSRLHHCFNSQPWEHGRFGALSVQQCSEGQQHSAFLQEPQPGSLSVGVFQLLPHVWAAHWLWRDHRDRWTGVCESLEFHSDCLTLSKQSCVCQSVLLCVCLQLFQGVHTDRAAPSLFYVPFTLCLSTISLGWTAFSV